MTDTTTERPGIDPVLKALLDAVPLEFTIDDGVEVARDELRALKSPPEMLPDMRIEERTVDHRLAPEHPFLESEVIAAFLTWYLPGVDTADVTSLPTDVAPADADTLAGLPPAFVGTAEHDPLRDDGGKYAEILAAADVSVEVSNEPTMVHGYASLGLALPAAAEATDRGLAALRAALARRATT